MGKQFGVETVRQLNLASETVWPEVFQQLRRDRRLSKAIRQIKALLDDPKYRKEAAVALRRIGLLHDADRHN